MVFKFLHWLKQNVTKEQFELILNITDADIKFNRISFGKRTNQKQYIDICSKAAETVLRAGIN